MLHFQGLNHWTDLDEFWNRGRRDPRNSCGQRANQRGFFLQKVKILKNEIL